MKKKPNRKKAENMPTTKDILFHVELYNSIEEYNQYNCSFEENFEANFIQDLTLSTYNGATNTSYLWEMNDQHIIAAIQQDIIDNESTFEFLKEINPDIHTLYDAMLEYVTTYSVFVINDRIYVDKD